MSRSWATAAAGAFNTDGTVNTSLDTRLYYAAVNGGVNFKDGRSPATRFSSPPPSRSTTATPTPTPVTRMIALTSATDLVILFQAIPAGETNYKLFRALVTDRQQCRDIPTRGRDPGLGGREDPGETDRSLLCPRDHRQHPAGRLFLVPVPLVDDSTYSDVYYARVGWDSARVLNNTILLTTMASSAGISPLPRLRLDSNRYSHVVWAANNTTGNPTGIYYAMVQAVSPSVVDNLAIGATQVLSGGYRWGFPNVLLTTTPTMSGFSPPTNRRPAGRRGWRDPSESPRSTRTP